MNIEIKKVFAFSELGTRQNQEDSYCFRCTETGEYRPYFILCDGMGGHEKGEVASSTVCEALSEYFDKYLPADDEVGEGYFEAALDFAYERLKEKTDGNSSKAPGTTLTCVYFCSRGAWCFHIGDSRIYHIRPQDYKPEEHSYGLMFQTQDHSLVNRLLKAGELTEQEARTYPYKNVITRALQARDGARDRADYRLEEDVRQGDYFFLCSDGVLERLSNEELCSILADGQKDDEEKLSAIKEVCNRGTADNHTCVLIPIDSVESEKKSVKRRIVIKRRRKTKNGGGKSLKVFYISALLIIVSTVIFVLFRMLR